MNISQAADACGLSSKAIRYYEELGLVVPMRGSNNGYRIYSQEDIKRLRFLQRARAVGFGLEESRELLVLYSDPQHRCTQVKSLMLEKIAYLDQQMLALGVMRATLEGILVECAGDAAPDPTIIDRVPGSEMTSSGRLPAMTFTLLDEPGKR